MALGKKKHHKLWVWIAYCRVSRRVVAFEIGSRRTKTLKRLWIRLQAFKIGRIFTDHYKAYPKVIPWQKLTQTKSQTSAIESLNANVRHYLARFRRRTRCYSKSPHMVRLSLLILFEQHLKSIY